MADMTEPTASDRDACPCGTGRSYDACCAPFHAGTRRPATAEQLMRARYSAYATANEGFLLATWHPTTRPDRIAFDPDLRWTGLDILTTRDGTAFHRQGTVEFVAHHESRRKGRWVPGRLHEHSRFVNNDRWYYLDGDVR